MVQAARSGKQNIVEAAAASTTSRGTELKLRRPMDRLKRDFLEGGGIREEMTRARLAVGRQPVVQGVEPRARQGGQARPAAAKIREIAENAPSPIANCQLSILIVNSPIYPFFCCL